VSELPFEGPIAGVRVGRLNGKLVINPKRSDLHKLDINMFVAGSRDAIVMVEGEAMQVPEKELTEALFYAHKEIQVLIEMQLDLQSKVGKSKVEVAPPSRDEALIAKMTAFMKPRIDKAIRTVEKLARRDLMGAVKKEAAAEFIKEGDQNAEAIAKVLNRTFEDTLYKMVREMAVNEKRRIDGRDSKTVRPIAIDVGLLPRTHGSAMFQRGETQAIVVATLGTNEEAQILDTLAGESSKRFMLHYNFPPFSTGETGRFGMTSRRETGHGDLAERSLAPFIPSETEFPYTIRVVSDILESNGSSSMATVCAGSLALFHAGVPLKAAVAGIAMGLIMEGDRVAVLSDILGDEDFLGDMDFKVTGTDKGITACQMDIKIEGLSVDIMRTALAQARDGRLHILGIMNQHMSAPNADLSPFAPKLTTITIPVEMIGAVIGPGGEMIRSIVKETGAEINIDDDGTITIAAVNQESADAAITTSRASMMRDISPPDAPLPSATFGASR
jgi:polyribonucleotide nucleotidyltransferase